MRKKIRGHERYEELGRGQFDQTKFYEQYRKN
jgi:hypothetical protein